MNNENLRLRLSIKMLSAVYATLLSLFVIWLSLGNWELKATSTIPYGVVLIVSGWAFTFWGWRITGIIHGVLMLLIAGYCAFACCENVGIAFADNPAAGTIAVVTLIIFVVGTLAAFFGIGSLFIAIRTP